MKLFIAGGCGFIGTNLIQYLLNHTDHTMVVYDDFSVGQWDFSAPYDKSRVTVTRGDICKQAHLQHWIQGCDVVINLAAQCGVQQSMTQPVQDVQVNVMGLVNLLHQAYLHKIPRVIHSSSFAVLTNRNVYGTSKLAGEYYCQLYSKLYHIDTVVLRYSNVYGPHSDHKTSVIAKWLRTYNDNKPLQIYGDGSQVRDFVYVGDVVETITHAVSAPLPTHHLVLPVCTGVGTSVKTVAEQISSNVEYTDMLPIGDGDSEIVDPLITREILNVGLDTTISEGLNKMM